MNQNQLEQSVSPMQGRTRIVVKPGDTNPFTCPCGGEVFNKGYVLRTLSPLLGGSKQPLEFPTLYCVKCSKPVLAFLPLEFHPIIELEVVGKSTE
jgi:hypothetical protein